MFFVSILCRKDGGFKCACLTKIPQGKLPIEITQSKDLCRNDIMQNFPKKFHYFVELSLKCHITYFSELSLLRWSSACLGPVAVKRGLYVERQRKFELLIYLGHAMLWEPEQVERYAHRRLGARLAVCRLPQNSHPLSSSHFRQRFNS